MAIENRYEFTVFFDVENGNPNGDPDAANSPRIDPETSYGFITDVCMKRKLRNYIELVKNDEPGYKILIKPDKALNEKFTDAYITEGLATKQKGKSQNDVRKARDFMCKNYYDVRAFGAVMSTGDDPCGIVRGPVQIAFAKSMSPICIQDVTITRQAKTTVDRTSTGETEMGRKSIIPYALYRADGYVSAALAQNVTGFGDDDLALLWEAVINMFEADRSAARGKMCVRKLYVFKHESLIGNCPANRLFDMIKVVQNNLPAPPRKFSDYDISVDGSVPDGVQLTSML